MKVLYLYTEVMGYTHATIKKLVEYGVEIHLVYWDKNKNTPYVIPELHGVYKYPRSGCQREFLFDLVESLSPAITVVSGWQDKLYLEVAKKLRKKNKAVVCGLDTQWNSSPKQYLAAFLGNFRFFSKYYTHAWVSGVYQFEYAKKLGFSKNEIIFDVYSADIALFKEIYKIKKKNNRISRKKKFLFVGRFEKIKGIEVLVNAWNLLNDSRNGWELMVVGNGSMKSFLLDNPDIIVKDFMQPNMLASETVHADCFILPSYAEPWGVVVHEFAAAGLPLILSNNVGSSSTFLIPGFNGYTFESGNASDLAKKMQAIINKSDNELERMGAESYLLSNRITTTTSAKNLMSIFLDSTLPSQ